MILRLDDGSLVVPVSLHADGLYGDTSRRVRPGEPGYDELAARAVPAEEWGHIQRPLSAGQIARLDALAEAEMAALAAGDDDGLRRITAEIAAIQAEPRPGEPGFADR